MSRFNDEADRSEGSLLPETIDDDISSCRTSQEYGQLMKQAYPSALAPRRSQLPYVSARYLTPLPFRSDGGMPQILPAFQGAAYFRTTIE